MSLKSTLVQFICTFVLANQSAVISFSIVWPSYALKVLESDASPLGFSLSKYESNLVGSIPMLGSLIATLVASYVCESIGRKKSQILTSLFFVCAWSLILTARSTIQILIGRFLTGLSSGLAIVVVFVYVGEITQLKIRGNATAMLAMMYNVGILVSYLQGWFCSYNVVCYISVTASVVYSLLFCCLKETPVYLLKIGQEKVDVFPNTFVQIIQKLLTEMSMCYILISISSFWQEEALASLKFFRGESHSTEQILEELSYLKSLGHIKNKFTGLEKSSDAEKENLHLGNDVLTENEKKNPWKLLFTVDYNRRALISIVTIMALSVSMGMIAVQAYAKKFFSMAAPTISPDLCSVLLALVFIVSSLITMVVTNMFSRRFLMISTTIIASICLAVLGSLLRWSWGPVWLAPLAIMLYCIVFHLGCIHVAFVQLSECFGPEVNSTATAVVLCFMFSMNFTVLSLFVPSVDYLGIDGTFFSFAAIGVVTTVVSILFLKETRHLPLEKVQRMFTQGFLYKKCETFESSSA